MFIYRMNEYNDKSLTFHDLKYFCSVVVLKPFQFDHFNICNDVWLGIKGSWFSRLGTVCKSVYFVRFFFVLMQGWGTESLNTL